MTEPQDPIAVDATAMDTYTACSIVEGFDNEPHTLEEVLDAWQYLVDTGDCWKLQGWYGRNAQSLIEQGLITPKSTSHDQD